MVDEFSYLVEGRNFLTANIWRYYMTVKFSVEDQIIARSWSRRLQPRQAVTEVSN